MLNFVIHYLLDQHLVDFEDHDTRVVTILGLFTKYVIGGQSSETASEVEDQVVHVAGYYHIKVDIENG